MQDNAKQRILIANDDDAASELLRMILTNEGYQISIVHTGEDAYDEVLTRSVHLAIVDVALGGNMNGYNLVRRVRQHPPTRAMPVLMLTAENTIAGKMAILESGADDFLIKPFQQQELIYRVKSLLIRSTSTTTTSSLLARKRGQVLVTFGTKGGVGKTTLAVNLAVTLQQRTRKRVALFDADFYFGDVGVHLNLPGGSSLLDLIAQIDRLELQQVDQTLLNHSSGLHVLLGPRDPAEAEKINAEHVKKLIEFLAGSFDYVIVDCHSSYDDRTLVILEQADEILLIVTPEVGPIKNATVFFDLASKMGLLTDSVHLVLNRANSNVGIEASGIEKALKRQVEFRIDSGGRPVARSVNHGVPLVIEQPDHPVAQQITRVAAQLVKQLAKT